MWFVYQLVIISLGYSKPINQINNDRGFITIAIDNQHWCDEGKQLVIMMQSQTLRKPLSQSQLGQRQVSHSQLSTKCQNL